MEVTNRKFLVRVEFWLNPSTRILAKGRQGDRISPGGGRDRIWRVIR